jgi:hypothetical protein
VFEAIEAVEMQGVLADDVIGAVGLPRDVSRHSRNSLERLLF